MKHLVSCFFLFFMTFSATAFGGQWSEIELMDGGIVLGEILSQSDGTVVVRSNSLGTVTIDESNIRLIRLSSGNSTGKEMSPAAGGSVSPDIEKLKTSIMNNKEVMGLVISLQNDPEMQALLNDPDIMAAVQSGDISALMSNPKFLKLLDNANIKNIQKKMLSNKPGTK
ncbi:MAG: hypothetical protein JRL30_17970 [Deltaproteobacteria bacterium]|nr:hypothetical protein [Deltaproteobacteria bacterium]